MSPEPSVVSAIQQTRFLTLNEVSEVLNTTPARGAELCRIGILPAVKLGRQVRVHPDRLAEFINSGGKALPGGWRRQVIA
jgi:putative molybdopterin biosynthesis protein